MRWTVLSSLSSGSWEVALFARRNIPQLGIAMLDKGLLSSLSFSPPGGTLAYIVRIARRQRRNLMFELAVSSDKGQSI